MRVTQGTFSFLPDMTDAEIKAQIKYAIDQGWAVNVEYTDDPHPRNTYWEMWCEPMFDATDPASVFYEVQECRKVFGNQYIRVNAFNNTRWIETVAMSFIVNRPKDEPGFGVERQIIPGAQSGRMLGYKVHSYATDKPEGKRYK